MAICFKADRVSFTKAKIPPSKHEVFAAVGRRTGQRRKIVAIVVYVPPHYNADQNRSLLSYTNDVLLAVKSKYDVPYIVYGGDFNRRDFDLSTCEHPEIKAINVGPTRAGAVLDILATNFNESLSESGTVEPIWSQERVRSDHRTVLVSHKMPRVPEYKIEEYSYRHLTEEGFTKFGEWLGEPPFTTS